MLRPPLDLVLGCLGVNFINGRRFLTNVKNRMMIYER